MCGEQLACRSNPGIYPGSPPRVRGTADGCLRAHHRRGITPACAGNSRIPTHCRIPAQDHPRVCGEQADVRRGVGLDGGSPPRVRGTVTGTVLAPGASRITPACAGNSPAPFPTRPTSGDHPRVCGEQLGAIWKNSYNWGSPPRVRGTVMYAPPHLAMDRITPACAGNSFIPGKHVVISQDHPRVCGEQPAFSPAG